MSDKVQGWVWDQDLAAPRKLILLWLAGRATDNGVAFPGQREIRTRTGLCERMVRYHLRWLASDRDEDGSPKRPLLAIVERRISGERNTSNVYVVRVPWAQPDDVRRDLDELRHVPRHALAGVGAMGCPQSREGQGSGGNGLPPVGQPVAPRWGQPIAGKNSHEGNVTGTAPPSPPRGAQQQQGECVTERTRGLPATSPPDRPTADCAEALVQAFYRGLGTDAGTLTRPLWRRELAIARGLTAVGATPAEAEAYARDNAAVTGRIAPVDLRSYERERPSWLARRCAGASTTRTLVDRTGQPPAGISGIAATIPRPRPVGGTAPPAADRAAPGAVSHVGALARAVFGGTA